MKSIYIDLDNGRMVKQFVEAIEKLHGSFELKSGMAVLDAKSVLGIYSLDLSRPLLLHVEDDTDENMEQLSEFIIK